MSADRSAFGERGAMNSPKFREAKLKRLAVPAGYWLSLKNYSLKEVGEEAKN